MPVNIEPTEMYPIDQNQLAKISIYQVKCYLSNLL